MRTNRTAFDALLLAGRAYDEINVWPGGEMDNQPNDRNNPTQDRDQLSILRLPALGVPHDPDGDADPGREATRDEKQIEETTS